MSPWRLMGTGLQRIMGPPRYQEACPTHAAAISRSCDARPVVGQNCPVRRTIVRLADGGAEPTAAPPGSQIVDAGSKGGELSDRRFWILSSAASASASRAQTRSR